MFFEEKFSDCYLGVEWGDIMGRRHMQCVVRDTAGHYSGGASLNAALKGVLGWKNEGGFRSTIMVRALAYTHLHTWIGMIGYCSKYEGESVPEMPFIHHMKGISDADLRAGKAAYIAWGRPNKNQVMLTPGNIVDRASHFASLRLRHVAIPNFWLVVGSMLASTKYVMSAEWCRGRATLDRDALDLLWRSRTAQHTFSMAHLQTLITGGS